MPKRKKFFKKDVKNRTERFGTVQKTDKMKGNDKRRMGKALGHFDKHDPPQQILTRLQNAKRFEDSELNADGTAIVVVSKTGYRGTHTVSSLHGIVC